VLFIKTKNGNGMDVVAYYHGNHLDVPLQATDSAGNVVWAANYNAFGRADVVTPRSATGDSRINSQLRLPGQYEDIETGLYYNFNRYYDPDIGGYITSDLIGGVIFGDMAINRLMSNVVVDPALGYAIDAGSEYYDLVNYRSFSYFMLEDGFSINNPFAYVGGMPLWDTDPPGLADGRGERGVTGGSSGRHTNNPYKHCREDPNDPNFILCTNHQTGTSVRKKKPADWPEDKGRGRAKSEMCDDNCQAIAGTVVVGGMLYILYRCGRMVPSLFPPLWWTIPANIAMP